MKKALKIFVVLALLFAAHFALNIVALFRTEGRYCDGGKPCPFLTQCEKVIPFSRLDLTPKPIYVCKEVWWAKNPLFQVVFGVNLTH